MSRTTDIAGRETWGPDAQVALLERHPPHEFRRALSAARLAAGLTQAGLAAKVGTTQSAIARLERGTGTPTVETLCRLADVLGITFEIVPDAGLGVRLDRRRGPTLEDLRARREELLRIAAARGAGNVRVFGSVARGEAGPASDIDFLVEIEPDRTLFDLSELILDLEEALGRKVDVVEVSAPSPVAERIQREAVSL